MIKHKYMAKPCVEDGIHFPSKLEKNYYNLLKILLKTEQIRYFLRQPSFDLPGGTRYRADFMVVNLDGSVEYIDLKGCPTPMSTLKIKQVEAIYPIKIKIVRKV